MKNGQARKRVIHTALLPIFATGCRISTPPRGPDENIHAASDVTKKVNQILIEERKALTRPMEKIGFSLADHLFQRAIQLCAGLLVVSVLLSVAGLFFANRILFLGAER